MIRLPTSPEVSANLPADCEWWAPWWAHASSCRAGRFARTRPVAPILPARTNVPAPRARVSQQARGRRSPLFTECGVANANRWRGRLGGIRKYKMWRPQQEPRLPTCCRVGLFPPPSSRSWYDSCLLFKRRGNLGRKCLREAAMLAASRSSCRPAPEQGPHVDYNVVTLVSSAHVIAAAAGGVRIAGPAGGHARPAIQRVARAR